jgi:segregation and condensation protein B
MQQQQLKLIIEGALLASHEPLTIARIASLFDIDEQASNEDIRTALLDLQNECAERAYELVEVSSGWRYQVRQKVATWVNKLWEDKPPKYSRATLETLALIAYRQPITRGDIEDVRGVAVSTNIIQSLMERNWVRIVGHRDVPGRPALYATTRQFLDYFNLKSLDQLPSLSEIRDIDKINEELMFEPAATSANDTSEKDFADEDDEAASSMATLILPGG